MWKFKQVHCSSVGADKTSNKCKHWHKCNTVHPDSAGLVRKWSQTYVHEGGKFSRDIIKWGKYNSWNKKYSRTWFSYKIKLSIQNVKRNRDREWEREGQEKWGVEGVLELDNEYSVLIPLGWTGWISLQSKGLARVFSNTQFKSINSV